MKCPACGAKVKEGAKFCKRCGYDFTVPPPWQPTWKWHAKVLGIIYTCLIVGYILLRIFIE